MVLWRKLNKKTEDTNSNIGNEFFFLTWASVNEYLLHSFFLEIAKNIFMSFVIFNNIFCCINGLFRFDRNKVNAYDNNITLLYEIIHRAIEYLINKE